MRTILDVDYHDDCLYGNGDPDSVKRMFSRAKAAGINSVLWAPMVCGKAHYPSRVAGRIGDSRTHPGTHHIPQLCSQFDPLEKAVELAAEFEMELLFYFRLLDDYYPGLESDYLDARPHLWWQSRCGHFQLRGWPSYAQPEVRQYKMSLFQELLAYKPSGFMIEIGRSHAMYANAPRAADFFGYEAPVAEEFERRYGVDIRAFDYMQGVENDSGIYAPAPFTYEMRYVNPARFDHEAWHWLKGEYIDSFIRDLRAASAGHTLLLQSGLCPPHPATRYQESAKFYIDANKLAQDGIIDGFSHSGNFRTKTSSEIDTFFFPWFQGVRDAGCPAGLWLNDILTANGGHGALAPLGEIESYIQRVLETSLDYAIIHESDFLTRHEQCEEAWQLMGRFSAQSSPMLVEAI